MFKLPGAEDVGEGDADIFVIRGQAQLKVADEHAAIHRMAIGEGIAVEEYIVSYTAQVRTGKQVPAEIIGRLNSGQSGEGGLD